MPLAFQIASVKRKVISPLSALQNMQDVDFEFLDNGICPDKIISRLAVTWKDGSLKRKQLNSFLSLKQFAKASKSCLMTLPRSVITSEIGIVAIDPKNRKKLG